MTELAIFMFIINSLVDYATGWIAWELGLAIMGVAIVLLAVLKDERWDKWILTLFSWGLSFFLYDLQSFVTLLFGGDLV